eukprot:1113830-Amorphochlora_amoeboformis.AAC.2
MAKRYCVVLASLSLALVPNPRPSPLQSRTSIHTLAPPLPCRRLGHVFSPEISLKGNGLQRGVRLRRAKGQVEPLATLGKGSKRIKDPMWREGVSPVLKEQMIKIVGANFTVIFLKLDFVRALAVRFFGQFLGGCLDFGKERYEER